VPAQPQQTRRGARQVGAWHQARVQATDTDPSRLESSRKFHRRYQVEKFAGRVAILAATAFDAACGVFDRNEAFAAKAGRGDIVVAGENFGCGSSRETAPLALQGAGIGAVVAVSFARIFFRNAINVGLPIIEAPLAFAECEEGHLFSIDPGTGAVTNVTTGRSYQAPPFPPEIRQIIAAGGLVQYVRRRLLGI